MAHYVIVFVVEAKQMKKDENSVLFGQRIKQLRIAKKMSQAEFAKRIGYADRSTIIKIEKGEVNVKRTTIMKMAEVLNTSAAYLMGWTDDANSDYIVSSVDEQIISGLDLLSDDEKKILLRFIRSMREEKAE